MTIGPDDVLHVAALAEIAVDEQELPTLVAQLNGIVAYVEQLGEVPAGETAEPYAGGPAQVSLRDDVVRRSDVARLLPAIAPEFAHGFFLVPRRGTLDDDA